MNVWLDDERPAPDGYVHCKTAKEAISLLETGQVQVISLDHDLGDNAGTGYDVALFIERAAHEGRLSPLRVKLHSMNFFGKEKMKQAIQSAKRVWMKTQKMTNLIPKTDCQEARLILPEYHANLLPLHDRLRIARHLSECPDCMAFSDSERRRDEPPYEPPIH